MLSKFKEQMNAARLRAGAWNRERKERAEERKSAAALNSEHGHGRFFLLHVPALATVCAAIVEWYWALLFCIEATGHVDWNYETSVGGGVPAASIWSFAFSTHWPVFIGLVCATVPIVMLSMVWLPVQFAMRGAGRWRRGTVILVGLLANVLVIVSGTVVMNYNRQDQVREAMVVEQTAQQGRAAIQAQIDAVNGDLERLTDRRINNEYAATAANVGAAAYRAQYMSPEALARSPEQRRDIIVRALGAAERADALRAERTALFGELAAAPTEAAVAANVEDTVGRELNTFAQYVEVWRPPFIAVICTLIGIFGAWWVLALMQGLNPRDVMRSGWAPEDHRIEDLREEAPVAAQPMSPPRQKRRVYNPETGREEVFVQPKGHWRPVGKKQRNADGTEGELTEFMPDPQPDETGVDYDGGQRAGSAAAEDVELAESVIKGGVNDAASDNGSDRESNNEAQQTNDDHLEPSTEPPPREDDFTPAEQDDEAAREEYAAALETLAATHVREDESPREQEEDDDRDRDAAEVSDEPTEAEDSSDDAGDDQEADEQVTDQIDLPDETKEREPETRPERMIAANVAAE